MHTQLDNYQGSLFYSKMNTNHYVLAAVCEIGELELGKNYFVSPCI